MEKVTASDLALDATIKAAAQYQKIRHGKNRFTIAPRDLHLRLRERRARHAVLILIDASASMRGQGKMIRVKGLAHSFMEAIYRRRDRIAVAAFRHKQTELVLPFTHNLIKAKQCLNTLPVGGKTPLADGLILAFKTLQRQHYQDPLIIPVLLIFSDGKPNVSAAGHDPLDETLNVSDRIRRNRIQSIFIDTEPNPLAFGYGPDIAYALGGLYINMGRLLMRS